MTERLEDLTVDRLLHGLRLATVLITAVSMFGLALPLLVANASTYHSLAGQVAAFILLVAVTAVAGGHVWWDRPLGPLRWVLLAAVAAAAVLAVTGVPAEHLTSESEWSYGLVGWFGLLLLLDHGVAVTVAFLAAHTTASLVHLVAVGQFVGGFVVVAVLVLGYQLPVVAATAVLRRLAATAASARRRRAEIRTAEAIAEQLHHERTARYAELTTAAVPLLANLANGTADLSDGRIRDAHLLAVTRMRLLFAESDDVPDHLSHELRACVDLAERRGVVVSFGAYVDGPTPPKAVRRALTEPVLRVLASAATTARVTVLGSPTALTVNVVADGVPPALPAGVDDTVTVTHLVDGDRIWVEATWQPKE